MLLVSGVVFWFKTILPDSEEHPLASSRTVPKSSFGGFGIREAASDFMGEWRLLRNWLEHPSLDGHAEKQYFNGAEAMVRLLGSQRGKPGVTVGDVFLLMEQLNALNITVNPLKQEPVVQFVEMDPETLAKIQGQMGPNDRLISW